jgi:hypothetical protein
MAAIDFGLIAPESFMWRAKSSAVDAKSSVNGVLSEKSAEEALI